MQGQSPDKENAREGSYSRHRYGLVTWPGSSVAVPLAILLTTKHVDRAILQASRGLYELPCLRTLVTLDKRPRG